MENIQDTSIDLLREAIIKQAIKDYTNALRYLRSNKNLDKCIVNLDKLNEIAENYDCAKRTKVPTYHKKRVLAERKRRYSKWRNRGQIYKFITYTHMKSECENFFKSDWYSCLCDIDGIEMMNAIRRLSSDKSLLKHLDD